MNAEPIGQNGRRLKTWKEIAAFFGCDERTVRRWEETCGLPVRRVPNSPRSAVFAYEGELRAWLNDERSRKADPPPVIGETQGSNSRLPLFKVSGVTRWLTAAAIVVAFAGALGALWYLRSDSGPGARRVPPPEAEKFYREGLYGWQSRTPAGLISAVDDFTQAIVRDPQYAQAYAGLAACYDLLREYTAMPPDYAFPRAKAAAERAIALDPSLSDAHAALAFADFYWAHDTATAQREFQKALALAPGDATVHHWYATFLMNLRQFQRALAEIDKAQDIDSASTSILADKGVILFYAGRTDEAMSLLHQVEETEPQFASPHSYLATIYRATGDDAGFVQELTESAKIRHHSADAAIAAAAAHGLSQAGYKGMLMAMLQAQRQHFSELESPAYVSAQTYVGLGDAAHAIQYLTASLSRHEPDAVSLNIDPLFAPLRASPEFRRLVRKAGVEPPGS